MGDDPELSTHLHELFTVERCWADLLAPNAPPEDPLTPVGSFASRRRQFPAVFGIGMSVLTALMKPTGRTAKSRPPSEGLGDVDGHRATRDTVGYAADRGRLV